MLSNMTHYSDFLLTRGRIFFSDFFSNLHPMILEVKKDECTAWGFLFIGTTTTVGFLVICHSCLLHGRGLVYNPLLITDSWHLV